MTTKISSANDSGNFRRFLLGATSASTLVAVGVALTVSLPNTAHAVSITSTNSGAATGTTNATTLTFATDGAFGLIDTNIVDTVTTTSVTEDGTLFLDDVGNGGNNSATVDFTQTVTIAAGKTLSIRMAAEVDSTIGDNVSLDFSGAVGGATGSLAITGFDGAASDVGNVEFGATVILSALTIESGDGGTAAGTALTLTDIVGASAVTTLIIRGGVGGSATASAGGAFILTNLTGAISGTTATISAGDGTISAFGGTGGAGGSMTVTAAASDISSTTLNFDAGDGAAGTTANSGRAGGAGGNSTFDAITGAITSTTFNIRGGAGGDGVANDATGAGGAGGTIAVFDIDGAVTANVNVLGGAGGDGATGVTAAAGAGAGGGAVGTGDGSFAALVTGNVVIQGGAAGSAGGDGGAAGGAAGLGGAVTVDNLGAGLVGNLTITGGAGSSGANGGAAALGGAGAAGGAATLSDISATGITGSDAAVGSTVIITGGAGGSSGDRGAGGVGGAGGIGGLAVLTTADAVMDIATITITGGDGGSGGAGLVGNAGVAAAAAGTADATLEGTDAFQMTTINIAGGDAGNGGAAGTTAAGGAGTAGGAASLTMDSATIAGQGGTGAVTITITGGAGGNGGNAGSGVAGVAGVAGGAAKMDLGTAGTIAANITLNDGEAGSAGSDSGTNSGGAAGAGGVATLDITAARTLTGDITAAADNEGLVTMAAGVFTVIGSIGVSGTEIDQINITGGSSGLTITGSIFAKDIDIAADDVLTLSGTSLQIITAAIDSAANTGDITTGTNAVVRFDGAIGKSSGGIADVVNVITLGTGSTTTFNSTVSATSITTNATGTTTIEDAIVLTGDFDAATGTTITLGKGIVAGETAISHVAGGAFAAGGITVNMPETFNTGTITLATESGNSGAAAADIANITFGTNFLTTFSAAADAGDDDVLVTAVRKSATTIASALSIRTEEASALDRSVTALASGDAVALTAMENALVAGGLTAKTAAETVGVQADSLGATSAVSSAVGGTVMSINTTRLAMLREGTAYATNGVGFAAGGGMMANHAWIRPFGTAVDQDATGGIAGFDATTFGAVGGFDVPLGTNGRIGISGSYASTSIDGEGAGNAQTDIDGLGLNLYGDFSSSNAYIEFLAGYGWNEIDSDRTITIGGLQRTASASFDSTQYTIAFGGGIPKRIGGGSFFTPNFSVSHTTTETDNYTETGGGNLNLTVSSADVSATIGTLGVRYHSVIDAGPGRTITPELSVALQYDFSSDEAVATGTFAGGGAAFTTTGAEVEELGANVGAGVSFAGPGMTVGVSYDAVLKSDYVSHTGAAELRVSF